MQLFKRVVCNDGFSVSVRASRYHYCQPRCDGLPIYAAYEVGFPSEPTPELACYTDGSDGNVFAYVPASVVLALIAKHGGIKVLTEE